MNEIREIVTRAVVAKGKKVFNLVEKVKTKEKPYSILGCWIINHEFEASKINEVVKSGNTYYYILDENNKKYILSIALSNDLPFKKINDKIKIGYYEKEKEIIEVIKVY